MSNFLKKLYMSFEEMTKLTCENFQNMFRAKSIIYFCWMLITRFNSENALVPKLFTRLLLSKFNVQNTFCSSIFPTWILLENFFTSSLREAFVLVGTETTSVRERKFVFDYRELNIKPKVNKYRWSLSTYQIMILKIYSYYLMLFFLYV